MKPMNHKLENLLKWLRDAHFSKHPPQADENWHRAVMQQIRAMEPSPVGDTGVSLLFERMAWKLVPVTVIMLVISVTALLKMDMVADWQLFQLLYDGLEDATYLIF